MANAGKGFWNWLWRTDKNRAVSPRTAGLLVAVICSIAAGINDWAFFDHARNWTLKPFEVIESRTFCIMEYKSLGSKSWYTGDSINCDEVDAYIAANPGKNWRSKALMHHRIRLGDERTELPLFLPETSLSISPLGPDYDGEAYVSPEFNIAEPRSDLIARLRAARDDWISVLFYGIAVLGMLGGEYFHRRRKTNLKPN